MKRRPTPAHHAGYTIGGRKLATRDELRALWRNTSGYIALAILTWGGVYAFIEVLWVIAGGRP